MTRLPIRRNLGSTNDPDKGKTTRCAKPLFGEARYQAMQPHFVVDAGVAPVCTASGGVSRGHDAFWLYPVDGAERA